MEQTIVIAEQNGYGGIVFTLPRNEETIEMVTAYRNTFENCRNHDKRIQRIQIGSIKNISLFRLKCDTVFSLREKQLEYLGFRPNERHSYCSRYGVDENYAVASILTGKTLVGYEPFETHRDFSITVQSNGFCLHCGELTSEFLGFNTFFSDEKTLKHTKSIDELLANVL